MPETQAQRIMREFREEEFWKSSDRGDNYREYRELCEDLGLLL